MADETTEVTPDVTDEVQQNENVNISIEQICAAIISTYKTVVVPLDTLLKDYSNKSIAVSQDEETKILTFTLTDNPPVENADTEVSEEAPAESE